MIGDVRGFLVRQPSLGIWFALGLLLSHPMASLADEAIELVEYMTRLQYFSHKVGLSIQAKNEPLARFYLHELEEIIEKLKEADFSVLSSRPGFMRLSPKHLMKVHTNQWV